MRFESGIRCSGLTEVARPPNYSRWGTFFWRSAGSVLVALAAGCAGLSTPPSRGTVKEVPDIQVVIGCRDCQIDAEVLQLVVKGYREAAMQKGYRVAAERQAILTLTEYSYRNTALMMVMGPLALSSSDEIKGLLTIDGMDSDVAHSSRSPFPIGRLDRLTRSFGEAALALAIK